MRISYTRSWTAISFSLFIATNSVARSDEKPVLIQTAAKTEAVAKPGSARKSVEVRDFEVRVDKRLVGTHRLTTTTDGDTQEATLQTDVRVSVIVYTYVFKSRGTEVWRGNRLQSSDVQCEDGGKKRSMTLKTGGGAQEITFDGKSIPAASPGLMTTAYWRLPPADAISKPMAIINVDTGTTHSATLVEVGAASVTAEGRAITCRQFRIDGPSPAELWFDDRDRLVRQTSIEQGHSMELRLKQIRDSDH